MHNKEPPSPLSLFLSLPSSLSLANLRILLLYKHIGTRRTLHTSIARGGAKPELPPGCLAPPLPWNGTLRRNAEGKQFPPLARFPFFERERHSDDDYLPV